MVRLTEERATHFDWLNGDIRTLREDYARVRAKPVPPDATWHRIGADPDAVNVLRFPGSGEAKTATGSPFSPWGEGGPQGRMRGSSTVEYAAGNPSSALRASSPQGEKREQAAAAIVYFHGGGFIVGSPVTHADIAARLAHHTGLTVYSVDYRLAPDHRAPAPAEDGITVIRHLISSGIDYLVICGDSAGGAIALATEASLPDDIRQHVLGVASFYGAHGLLDTESLRTRGNRADGTDRDCVNRYLELAGRDAYSIETLADLIANEKEPLPNPSPQGGGATSPLRRAKSLHVSIGDIAAGLAPPPCGEGLGRGLSSRDGTQPCLAPIYLIAAEDDALRDDTLILADALITTGRTVTLDRVPDVDHGFLHGGEGNAAAEAALARFAIWLTAQQSQ